jgi:hypothetical protein
VLAVATGISPAAMPAMTAVQLISEAEG